MSKTKQTPIKEWIQSLKNPPSVRLYNILMSDIYRYFPTKESLLETIQESPDAKKRFLFYRNLGWKTLDELCRLLEVPLLPRPVRKKAKRKEFFKKDEIIHIGKLLDSVDKFDNGISMNYLPDPKNKDRIYVQVRSGVQVNKQRKWYGKYVGVKDKHTTEDLAKATEALKQRYRNDVNQELAAFNCKIEDFK
jgi:hypothetical protein